MLKDRPGYACLIFVAFLILFFLIVFFVLVIVLVILLVILSVTFRVGVAFMVFDCRHLRLELGQSEDFPAPLALNVGVHQVGAEISRYAYICTRMRRM